MITYRFDLYRAGIKLAELTGVKNISLGFTRNDYKKCTLDHLGNNQDPVILSGLVEGSEIRVFRRGGWDGAELQLIWAGQILQAKRSIDDKGQKTMHLEIEHWAAVFLRKRYITIDLNGEESLVAWDVINELQTNTFGTTFTPAQINYGFSQGVLEPTGNTRSESYVDQEALAALQKLANDLDIAPNPNRLRGFIISPDITNNSYLQFNYFANLGEVKNVTYTNAEIKTLDVTKSILAYSNWVTADGKSNIHAESISSDQISLDTYKVRQEHASFTDVSDTNSLQAAADQELKVRIDPVPIYNIILKENDINVGQFGIGDTIFIKFQDPTDHFLELDTSLIVFGIDLRYDDKGLETATLTVAASRPVSLEVEKFERMIKKVERADKRLLNLEKQ